jgi:hypothetical protein
MHLVTVPMLDSTISSYSTATKSLVNMPQVLSTITGLSTVVNSTLKLEFSNFSTNLGQVVNTSNFSNTLLSNNTVRLLNISTLNTSTLNMSGSRMPFIQYGIGALGLTGNSTITLSNVYASSDYSIQLTYTGNPYSNALFSSTITTSNFQVYGVASSKFHWTTYGNLF